MLSDWVRAVLVLPLVLLGCRTTSGVDERAEALLADYRSRGPSVVDEADRREWATGQFTVHVWSEGDRKWLERVSLESMREGRVRVSLDRLGVNEQLRVTATLSSAWTGTTPIDQLLTEAWVREADRPEIHFTPSVPAWVAAALTRALERPTGGGTAELTTPAGHFVGCVGGAHVAVPLSGVVRSESGGRTRELVEFGDDGGGALY